MKKHPMYKPWDIWKDDNMEAYFKDMNMLDYYHSYWLPREKAKEEKKEKKRQKKEEKKRMKLEKKEAKRLARLSKDQKS